MEGNVMQVYQLSLSATSEAQIASELAARGIDFCQVWPIAKPLLEAIGSAVPTLKLIIGILVYMGDAYYEKRCGQHGSLAI
jgi:hypothetical protein